MLIAYITHPSCRQHEMGLHHPECPERLDAIHDRMISDGLDGLVSHHQAPRATREQLERVHSARYIDEIEAASPTAGVHFVDPDTALNPYSLDAARHAAGAAVLATDLVMRGECSAAFCAVRPPGHHATRETAMGFCLFNNVAVGVAHALEKHGLARAAVVDFDVHHGNGTEDIFAGDPRVLMTGTFQYPLYPYTGVDPRGPNMHNVPLAPGSGGDAFRKAFVERCLPALEAHRPEIVFVSAGFDAHREDPLANLKLSEADFAWVTAEIAQVAAHHADGRIVSTLEGGYSLAALGRSAAAHVRTLAGT
ncbi:MAG TPA: histone deacetylase family protein [Casimicrobiaceae bacterium]|jgi:acetoin utilization deacetylase AcuC-like enzyme